MTAGGHGGLADGTSKLAATRLWLSPSLDDADREALARACGDVRPVSVGTDLLRHGASADALHILLDGWAARYKIMADGTRFIPALATPGDICDLDALKFDRLDYGVTMLSAGSVAVLPRQRVETLLAASPAIAAALWSLALAENSILTEWAASVGRRSAQDRLAHLFCELLVRLTVVGKADGHSYHLPVTQEQMADALGLTAVHVNRTLQSLRSKQLVSLHNRRVTILDWAALSGMCGFRSSYLHLETVADDLLPDLPASPDRPENRVARMGTSFLAPLPKADFASETSKVA